MTKTAKTHFAFTFFDTQSKADFSDINIHKEAFTPELFSFAFNTTHPNLVIILLRGQLFGKITDIIRTLIYS